MSFSSRSSFTSMRTPVLTGPSSHRVTTSLGSGSVYGGAGGSGVRISKASNVYSSDGGFSLSDAITSLDISDNKKVAMQNLNDRLASYLEKVRNLEKANADLEMKIREFLEKKTSPEEHDCSVYKVVIRDLQDQVIDAARGNAALYLAIDNAKLATDDFKLKFDNELSMRQSVEADVYGLRKVLEDLNLKQSDMEMQVENLKDELILLKRNHEQDLLALRTQMGGQVNVEVDAAPQEDLTAVMAGIRDHYEKVTAKNRKDLETWFQTKTAELNKDVAVRTETLQTSRSEISELKRTLQSLEIKLQAQISKKGAVEASLDETQRGFAVMLSGFQQQVEGLQEQLTELRADLENQQNQYSLLLDLKTRLELEIAEYRRLLDGEAVDKTVTTTKTTRVVTIVQEVDSSGNILSTSTSS